MSQADVARESFTLEAVVTPRVAVARLALGVFQGLLLYLLYRAATAHLWPATAPYLFAPLVLLGVLLPVLLISSLGHLAPKTSAQWLATAALVIVLLALHDVWRGALDGAAGAPAGGPTRSMPSPLLWVFSCAGFYIAHALVLAGALERRRIASYASYFETAWKLAIQLLFSALFVGALFLVLNLGAALFMLVKLDFLKRLLDHSWFVIPVICFAFSCAMHLTDVRPAIVRGIRTLLLVLLSWILPITALMVGGFMLSLPFTGLAPLWATRHATSVLLGSAAALVILINAAFQNGEVSAGVPRVVGLSARLAALLLLPISAIAMYALGLRVGDHGWTADRIIAAACLTVAGCYAIGYAWAARASGRWLHGVAGVNVATAFVVLGLLLALFTPLADPARLSVASQMARLAAGKIGADKFDFAYLRFEGARYGRQALAELASNSAPAQVRERAAAALAKANRWGPGVAGPLTPVGLAANLHPVPASARVPDSFLRADWSRVKPEWILPLCLYAPNRPCDAYMIDFDGDGQPEVLLMGEESGMASLLRGQDKDGHWQVLGRLPEGAAQCAPLRRQLAAGEFRLRERAVKDLEVGGVRLAVLPQLGGGAWRCVQPGQ